MNEILQVATLAGQILLENGAETYRVEETIWRICKMLGAQEAECFVTPTGIMTSICHDGKSYSLVRRVSNRTVDLDKIHKVNDLSRNILTKELSVADLKNELRKINKGERYSFFVTLFFSAFGAGCFAATFGGDLKDMFSAFLIGLVVRLITIKGGDLKLNAFIINCSAGAISAFLAIILYKLNIASSIDETIIGSIMLLVPGLALTNSIRDTFAGDLLSGLIRCAEAVLIAISIAVGTGSVLSLWLNYFGGY